MNQRQQALNLLVLRPLRFHGKKLHRIRNHILPVRAVIRNLHPARFACFEPKRAKCAKQFAVFRHVLLIDANGLLTIGVVNRHRSIRRPPHVVTVGHAHFVHPGFGQIRSKRDAAFALAGFLIVQVAESDVRRRVSRILPRADQRGVRFVQHDARQFVLVANDKRHQFRLIHFPGRMSIRNGIRARLQRQLHLRQIDGYGRPCPRQLES